MSNRLKRIRLLLLAVLSSSDYGIFQFCHGIKTNLNPRESIVRELFNKDCPETSNIETSFHQTVQSYYEGAVSNNHLVATVVDMLYALGVTPKNTLLSTSLCCDELARQLETDFSAIYGKHFSLGGLSGFPFAGHTGFGAMAAHVPDNGFCLIVYGPHVGIAADGTVGKVERAGIALIDTCCGSAIAAARYVQQITDGEMALNVNVHSFKDFQQGVVRTYHVCYDYLWFFFFLMVSRSTNSWMDSSKQSYSLNFLDARQRN